MNLHTQTTAKLLSRWAAKGWIVRIKQGVYIPVPLESITADIALENPWAIAKKLYHPCYISGFSAAEHWGLTEQIFRTITVQTAQKPRNRQPTIQGTKFLLHTIPEKNFFGLKTIWPGNIKILIADPSRTILDFLIDPKLGGGIRMVADMFNEYLKSEHKNLSLLIEYTIKINNGAVFKRLGFLLEQYAPAESTIINICKKQMTISKAKLEPQLNKNKFVTRWRLWVPTNWDK